MLQQIKTSFLQIEILKTTEDGAQTVLYEFRQQMMYMQIQQNVVLLKKIKKRERIKKMETKLNSLQPDTEDPSSVSHLCDPKPDPNCNH